MVFAQSLPRRAFAAVLSLALYGLAAQTGAQAPTTFAPLKIEGDVARGKVWAFTCAGCHGIPGYMNAYPEYNVPKLGGQNADYIEVALQGYRAGTRHHQTMQAQAQTMSDQDIADIAAYLSSLKGEGTEGMSDATAAEIQAGQQQSTTCAMCHGPGGIAEAPQWPNLAGQHASYLEHALKQYKSGTRSDVLMGPMVATLDEEALAAVAAYFASLQGLHVTAP